MAFPRHHVALGLRVAAVVWLLLFAAQPTLELRAQGPAPPPASAPPGTGAANAPAANGGAPAAGSQEFMRLPPSTQQPEPPQERVMDIRIIGTRTKTPAQVIASIGTRVGQPFDQATYEKDIRKLSAKNWFVHVQPQVDRVPGGVIITLEVVERPTLEYVRYLGAKRVKERHLAKETGLKKGDSLDPYAVQDGQRKIESYYQGKGYNDVKVSILEGTKPTDRGAVYLINEGRTQKFREVKFVGNSTSVAPDGRLKQIVQSRTPMFWIFKGQVDRKKIEEDVDKLTSYYRGLGFFKANITRETEYNEQEDRVTLTFYIVEGPRYRVRNIAYLGNKVYQEEALNYNQKLKIGDYYDKTKMDNDIASIKDLYGSHGYVFCDAAADLQFFLEPGELDLVYKVSEGKQYRIGDITIRIKGDNPHTRYATVLNRLSMRPGDIADIRQFRNSERRLKGSGLFNTAPDKGEIPKIVFSPPDSEDGTDKPTKKRSATARRNGDSYRGQSPDRQPTSVSPVGYPGQQTAYANQPAGNQPASYLPAANSPTGGVPMATGNTPAAMGNAPAAMGNAPYNAAPGFDPQPVQRSGRPVVRFQSPGYSGYGGTAINSAAPGPQPYNVNQPAYNNSQPPGYSQPPFASQNGPPANYAPGYGQGAAPPTGNMPQGLGGPPPMFGGSPEDIGQGVDDGPLTQPSIPIEVVTGEAQTGKFMFGAGVNSNAGLVGSVIIDEQNFDWQRFPSSWEDFRSGRAFRGAGQKFRIEAAPGTQVSRYMFNFTEPYMFDTPVSYGLSGYYFNRFYRDWTEQRVGGRTSLGYQITPDFSGNVTLRAEDIRISQPRLTTVPDLNAVLGHSQLYSVKPQISYDTRDSTFLPTQGVYFSTDFEYAFGTFQYPKYTATVQTHYLLHERPDTSGRHTLSYYGTFGISGSSTPIYERFFAGGYGTLRGFQFRGASPQIDTVEVGGILELINSVEYMFPITADDMLKGVAFVDFGTVEYTTNIYWQDFRIAPGLGLRVTVPMISAAPIALDFAVPVHQAPGDIKQIFSFFVGLGH